ncbi:scarecrow-like protein 9 [Macadamia integrifolia]|uniref:scarecrow-like protein 9 n=1 Tax=Macadamia integrifolia TaxID=60698 RepID=UPI001C531F3B|nr:scarecrow-like protein 9 [Macadamia integrifolia]
MIMDPYLSGISALMNGFRVDDWSGSCQNLSNGLKLEEAFVDRNFTDLSSLALNPNSRIIPAAPSPIVIAEEQCPEDFTAPPSVVIPGEESLEDCDLSDVALKFIDQILMEEDIDEKTCMYQESSALQAAEKPFYDILGKKYPPSPLPLREPDQHHFYCDHDSVSPDDHFTNTFSNGNCSGSYGIRDAQDSCSISYLGEYKPIWMEAVSSFYSSPYTSQSCLGTSNGVTGVADGVFGFVESPFGELQFPCLFSGRESGVEEANKFLPNGNELIPYPEKLGLLPGSEPKEAPPLLVKVEPIDERGYSPTGVFKGRKHLPGEDPDLERGRRIKQLAVYTEEAERTEMFDMVLLCDPEGKGESSLSTLHEALQNGRDKNGQSNGSTGGKSRGKKQGNKREVVDLRTLLIRCAEAVTKDDRRSADELLKQIRQNSSPYGDGLQRLAYYFADSLQARLDGSGSQRYIGTLSNLRTSASDILRAYHLYLGVCPFKKLSNFFSNRTIFNVAEKAMRLHIIDFGILYGFQWPSLIQNLSNRPGGPPKLRITGIELPQYGFRPSARVEETGRRLADYAKKFNVPFEYNAIAQKWETITLEDLKIDRDEVLAVNCLYRFRNLLDETVVAENSPRNAVLNLIKRMNPDVFVQGVHNGAYGAPFFDTRFKEALFHFSAMFDMLEMNILPESHERILLEREIFAREAMNVISCEGSERVERPETFKQWQIRNVRAGLEQLPLNPVIMKKAKDKVKSSYHKDFDIGQEGNWMLQGWKGRIIYALSSWRSMQDS